MDGVAVVDRREHLAGGRIEAHQASAQGVLGDQVASAPVGHHPEAAVGAELDALGRAQMTQLCRSSPPASNTWMRWLVRSLT